MATRHESQRGPAHGAGAQVPGLLHDPAGARGPSRTKGSPPPRRVPAGPVESGGGGSVRPVARCPPCGAFREGPPAPILWARSRSVRSHSWTEFGGFPFERGPWAAYSPQPMVHCIADGIWQEAAGGGGGPSVRRSRSQSDGRAVGIRVRAVASVRLVVGGPPRVKKEANTPTTGMPPWYTKTRNWSGRRFGAAKAKRGTKMIEIQSGAIDPCRHTFRNDFFN